MLIELVVLKMDTFSVVFEFELLKEKNFTSKNHVPEEKKNTLMKIEVLEKEITLDLKVPKV